MLELLKVIVQPVCLERDEAGVIIGERLGQSQPLYTSDQIGEFFTTIESAIAEHNETS